LPVSLGLRDFVFGVSLFSTTAVSASRASAVSDKVSDNPVKAMA
jgi:hypothetical protein